MANLAAIGPAPREPININPGNGQQTVNGQQQGNGQQTANPGGNTPPVADGQPYETQGGPNPANPKNQNPGGQGPGQGVPGGPKAGNQTVIDAGPKPPPGQIGPGPRGPEYKIRGPRNITLVDLNWPILSSQFPDNDPLFESDDYRKSSEARDRQFQEGFSANQANLRRGRIRDYLRQNLESTLLETNRGAKSQIDLQGLTRTVADRLSKTFNDPAILNGRNLNLITREISHLLTNELRPTLGSPNVVPYDRAIQIASLLLARAFEEAPKTFVQITDREMLEALLFLQLCSNPGSQMKELREITSYHPSILPESVPWAAFRDTGLLAANLMKVGLTARDNAFLDAAVQRFFKLLVANNELGVLLAAVRLTADARSGRLPNGSVASLVRIYELIAQLMIVTQRAMKEAAEIAARKPVELKQTDRNLAFAAAMEPSESEAALRQFLTFNPSAQADSGASAFFNEEVAETSARIAVDSSHREITEWLNSGRHRFVTEVDLGKPVGIVIDRSSDECFTASQIRVVLVRDGSVLGWHILRSCLVG